MQPSLNHLILDLYHDAQAGAVHEFSSSLLGRLKRVLRFDSGGNVLLHVDDDGRTTITGQAGLNVHPDKARLRTEYVGVETYDLRGGFSSRDILLRRAIAQPDRSHAVTLAEVEEPDVKEYGRITECLNAFAHITKSSDRRISSFSMWRAAPEDVFTQRDLALADMLVPHALQAITINRKLTAAALTGGGTHAGFLIAEEGGLIHYLDDTSILLLRREYPDWLSDRLPTDIREALRSTEQRYVGKHIMLSVRRQGSLMMITLQGREPGRKLTPAELRVVQKIVEHGTYKEAARQLGVSPSTVRNQLHAIYQKLGISSKSELVKVLSP